jgi:hypothetical protein
MIVTLNGYTINNSGGPNAVYLEEDLLGLDLPAIRTSSGNYSGRDGGYIGGQLYSARDITLQGRIFSSNVATLETARKALQNAVKGQGITMGVVTNAGAAYVIYCNLIDFEMPIKRQVSSAPFKIELYASDPTIYDDATGTALTASISRIVSGGYTYPVTYPVTYAGSTGPTTVTNSGDVAVYPTITLTGAATNPIITNRLTNEFIGLSLTTGPSDVIVIDMRQRTILLNGGSIFALQTASSTFWTLEPGGNPIALTTSNGSDTVTGVVSWRSGFMGI